MAGTKPTLDECKDVAGRMAAGYAGGVEGGADTALATAGLDGLIGALRAVRGSTTVVWLIEALRRARTNMIEAAEDK
jgi:hypothetical protein